jgi:hypothetical protein
MSALLGMSSTMLCQPMMPQTNWSLAELVGERPRDLDVGFEGVQSQEEEVPVRCLVASEVAFDDVVNASDRGVPEHREQDVGADGSAHRLHPRVGHRRDPDRDGGERPSEQQRDTDESEEGHDRNRAEQDQCHRHGDRAGDERRHGDNAETARQFPSENVAPVVGETEQHA